MAQTSDSSPEILKRLTELEEQLKQQAGTAKRISELEQQLKEEQLKRERGEQAPGNPIEQDPEVKK
jgi:hypothetical protein